MSHTIGSLEEKALGKAKKRPVDIPKYTPEKRKFKPSLIWSEERYKKGQEQEKKK